MTPPLHGRTARFLAYLRPYRGILLLSTLIGVVKYNLPVAFPWLLREGIDTLLAGRPGKWGLGFDQLMLAAAGVFVAYAVASHLRTYVADRLSQRMILDVRTDLFRHLQQLPLSYFQARQTGAIATRVVTDVSMAQNIVGLLGTNVFMDVTSLGAIGFMMLHMNARLALLAFSTLPLYALLQRFFARRMRQNAREARARMARVEGALHESIAGIAEVKSFTAEALQHGRFTALAREHREAAMRGIGLYAWSLGATALLTRLPAVLVIWVGGHMVQAQELTVGALLAFYAYMEMLYRPLERLSELNIQVANARAAIQRVVELLEEEAEEAAAPPRPALRVTRGAIELRNVVFGYQPGRPVFDGLSLRIEPGERVALVGRSGAGKSTLVKLLARFYHPSAGSILIDGQDVARVALATLRAQIAFVHQDLTVFDGSVADNVALGRPGASRGEIEQALQQANALEFVRALPQGLDTPVGERGVRLSGGQRQRLVLARAFLRDAPILVLDESTSSLDPQAEAQVYAALQRLMAGRTTILIAHRRSTVRRATRVVVLEGGRIVKDVRRRARMPASARPRSGAGLAALSARPAPATPPRSPASPA